MNYFDKPFWKAKRLQMNWGFNDGLVVKLYHDRFRLALGKFGLVVALKGWYAPIGFRATNFSLVFYTGWDNRPADQIRIQPFGGGRPERSHHFFQPWPWSKVVVRTVNHAASIDRPFTLKQTGEVTRVIADNHITEIRRMKWLRWLPILGTEDSTCRLRFRDSIGPGKRTYKGGCCGTYWTMKSGESLAQTITRAESELVLKR